MRELSIIADKLESSVISDMVRLAGLPAGTSDY